MWLRIRWCDGGREPPHLCMAEPPGCYFARARAGSATRKKTTARGGKSKSAQSRAESHVKRSAGAGRAGATRGKSRTAGKPPPRARVERGPGDVGMNVRIQT